MKPDWDKLTVKFEDNPTVLIADVDCTAEGKPLCDANGVEGFPTLKHGSPDNLQEYEGGRDYDELLTFAADAESGLMHYEDYVMQVTVS